MEQIELITLKTEKKTYLSHILYQCFISPYSNIENSMSNIIDACQDRTEIDKKFGILGSVLQVCISFGYPSLERWHDAIRDNPNIDIHNWIMLGIYVINLIDQKEALFKEFEEDIDFLTNSSNFNEHMHDPIERICENRIRGLLKYRNKGMYDSNLDYFINTGIREMNSTNPVDGIDDLTGVLIFTWSRVNEIPLRGLKDWRMRIKKCGFIISRDGTITLGVNTFGEERNEGTGDPCDGEYELLNGFRSALPPGYFSSTEVIQSQWTFNL